MSQYTIILQSLNRINTYLNQIRSNSKRIDELPLFVSGSKYVAVWNPTTQRTEKHLLVESGGGSSSGSGHIVLPAEDGVIQNDNLIDAVSIDAIITANQIFNDFSELPNFAFDSETGTISGYDYGSSSNVIFFTKI